MVPPFDHKAIDRAGWRQGSVLDGETDSRARQIAPGHVALEPGDWLIVVSHD